MRKHFIGEAERMEHKPDPVFVDGVIKLHKQLHDAYLKTIEQYSFLFGNNVRPCTPIKIWVDFSESQQENRLKGYFVFNFIVYRCFSISFDTALLFTAHDHQNNSLAVQEQDQSNYKKILELSKSKKCVIFLFYQMSYSVRILTGEIKRRSFSILISNMDAVGKPMYQFPDIDVLKLVDIPVKYLNRRYTFVGPNSGTPLCQKTKTHCVLFAQVDNKSDSVAIQVLRWFPTSKSKLTENINEGDLFYEMGYISQEENSELHTFMLSKKSRLLFGECENGKISILGGVKIFLTNDLNYPKCLYKINVE